MTLIVTKEIAKALGCCGNGYVTFENRLGDRPNMPYQELINIAFEMDKIAPEDKYVYWATSLPNTYQFHLMQGAFTVVDKYQVFNHKTGQHEPFSTLEEAKARQQQIIDEFIQEHKDKFSINQEILVNDGKDAMWAPLEEIQKAL
jgi:hypothetical protein